MKYFNSFNTSNLRGDIFGGVTAAIVSLPLALAFGLASGAGPEAGLYGAIIIGLFAAIFGGTPTLISEPTGPMTVVMTAVITTMIAANPENGLAMAFTVVMIAGLFQILLGVLKLGKYITLMPYSVISGFMSGIGIILIVLQIAPFLGLQNPSGSIIEKITQLPELIPHFNWRDLILGVVAIAILFLTPKKISKIIPPQLLVLLLITAVSVLLFSSDSIQRIGEISLGVPQLYFPTFTSDQVTTMIIDGIALGMLGCIDSLLTAVISDSLTRQQHKSNKELVGQGIANMMSGFFGGLPGAGATMGTVVNIQTGARTAISGVTRSVVLFVCVIGLGGLTQYIPLSVLAAIALKVGVDILDWSFIKRAHRVSLQATFIMYGVILLTVFVDLIVAVGVGVFIANILTIERLSQHQAENNIRAISDTDDAVPLSEEEKDLLDKADGKTLLLYFSGPLIFGMSKAIAREHEAVKNYDNLVLDLSNVPHMDATSLLAIENVIVDSLAKKCSVHVVCPSTTIREAIEKIIVDIEMDNSDVKIVSSRKIALLQSLDRNDERNHLSEEVAQYLD